MSSPLCSERVRFRIVLLPALTLAFLGTASVATAGWAPRFGGEVMIQHAREHTEGLGEPTRFPVSGGVGLTATWQPLPRMTWTTGAAYEDRGTLAKVGIGFANEVFSFETRSQWRSLVIPLRAGFLLGRSFELEAGPEWRWLLQSRTRLQDTSIPFVTTDAGIRRATSAEIFEKSADSWITTTDSFERGSFAVSAGAAFRRELGGGAVRIGFRWSEALTNQRKPNEFETSSRFREFQLVAGWSR